jgi:hypothetical protein
MTQKLLAVISLSLSMAAIASGQSTSGSTTPAAHYTQAQLKEMERNATTPDRSKTLASYFGDQKQAYLQQAADEKKEWERRSQNATSIAAKYPRPVDSARNLYEYYMAKANEASDLEAKYSQLISPRDPITSR